MDKRGQKKNLLDKRHVIKMLTASISICRSASLMWWPSFCKPFLSCSILILLLLSVSIILNASFIPATSSPDKCSATTYFYKKKIHACDEVLIEWKIRIRKITKPLQFITLKALFLSLFIIENCLSLDLTTSPSSTFGALLESCNQGCSASKTCEQKN